MVEVKDDKVCDNRLMVAISFVHLLYMETQHSLIKKIIREENNFTGKIKGKIRLRHPPHKVECIQVYPVCL